MGFTKIAQQDDPPPSNKIQTCRWGIGKTAPFLIIGPYCLGIFHLTPYLM